MSKIEVDAIEPQSGTTLTLGASGDSVNIASGATITDFTSTGIDDNATSNAITIESTERVQFTRPRSNTLGDSALEIQPSDTVIGYGFRIDTATNSFIIEKSSPSGFEAERMRIDGVGQHTITGDVNSTLVEAYNDHATSPFGYNIYFRNASPDNNANYFLNCSDSTTARARIESDGDLQNHDNSYGSISDERIKQDIRDSNSQWNDIKNIRVRNFKKKDDVRQYGENAWEQIGVIAQELEQVSPKLIKHSDPTPSDILSDASFGTLYQEGDEIPEGKKVGDVKEVNEQVKAVNYSILYMKSIKALQEAMERIETLEAKVTALENK